MLDGAPALSVCVQDNGPGLSPEERVHFFDAFFTTKQKGTDLGMSIVRKNMEAHGGRILADNGDSGGAAITLLIPSERRGI